VINTATTHSTFLAMEDL